MAINRMDHAAIRVDDMGAALHWYRDVLGLTVLDRDDERVHLACSGDAADVTLVPGGQSIVSFALGVDSADDLEEIGDRLARNGVEHRRYRQPDRPGHDEVLGFDLPTGHRMEFAVGADGRVAGRTETTSDGTHRPTDIDHVNLLGNDSPAVITDFLTMVLGFKSTLKLSVAGSWAGTWLRAQKTDHDIAYMMAVRESDRLHHVAFAVEDGNHYFRLSDRLAETGNRWEFGPGRHIAYAGQPHGLTANNFAYAFDPTGNRNEFSSGMGLWEDDVHGEVDITPEQVGEVMNGWTDNMPPTFMTQGS